MLGAIRMDIIWLFIMTLILVVHKIPFSKEDALPFLILQSAFMLGAII